MLVIAGGHGNLEMSFIPLKELLLALDHLVRYPRLLQCQASGHAALLIIASPNLLQIRMVAAIWFALRQVREQIHVAVGTARKACPVFRFALRTEHGRSLLQASTTNA